MKKLLQGILCLFLVCAAPIRPSSYVKDLLVRTYIAFDDYRHRVPVEQLPTIVHDDFKSIFDLLISIREHAPQSELYRLTRISPELFFEEEIKEIENYLRPFIPESAAYNAARLNNFRWALKGSILTAYALLGGHFLYNLEESNNRKAAYAAGLAVATYGVYRVLGAMLSTGFNYAGTREFVRNAREVLKKPIDEVPERFHEFHKKYQGLSNRKLVEAFTSGRFVRNIVSSLLPKGL